MAAGRGLNKGRGLGSLIPPRSTVKKPETAENNQPQESVRKESTEEPKSKVPAAKAKPAGKSVKPAVAKTKKTPAAADKKPAAPAAKKAATAAAKKAASTAAEKKAASAETAKKPAAAAKKPAQPTAEKKAEAADTAKKVPEKAEGTTEEAVMEVRITEIVPNREQPRKRFEEEGLEELAASIKEHGIITPLLVQKKGKYYELIAGERRWRAAKEAGLKKVPVLLRSFTEQEAAEIALIENIQRENLNAMEEAQAYKMLLEEYSLKQEDIAKRVSKSRSSITNALRLLKLEESVQDMLAEGKISMGHARALLALENPELQKITAERIAENDLSVRETEKLVKRLQKPRKAPAADAPSLQIEAVFRDLEEQIRKAVGTRVTIQPIRGKKGRIEIEYYSNEDLERILDKLRQN